ncbi:nucleotidyltransferase domain-containing protein [Facklamia hominis]|nr:nucleotidyltransferase domain-containing protein [Facklamia hominis]
MSRNLDKTNIINNISENINIFQSFDKVYIFGSILNPEKDSNDIDLLLLYRDYSDDIKENINAITDILQLQTSYIIDITALSTDEENEVNFIEKLNNRYLCVK